MKKVESVKWPAFKNNGMEYPTEIEADGWKCPLCSHTTPRIRQHLSTHKDIIVDWSAAEIYCEEVAVMKRRLADRERGKERDKKRAGDPKRKETIEKAKRKYAKTDGGKAAKKKYVETDGGKAATREMT